MAVAVAVVAAATATGNQDITTADLGGETPKAVLFIYSRSGTDGTITADGGAQFGLTDGTNQVAVAAYKRDGQSAYSATTTQASVGKTNKCLVALDYDGGGISVHSEASFVSFIAGGVRVNWSTAHGSDAWLITALFFSGTDWTVTAGNVTTSDAGTAVALGYEPELVFLIGENDTLSGSIRLEHFQSTFGASCWASGGQTDASTAEWGANLTNQNATIGTITYPGYHFVPVGQHPYAVTRTATSFTVATVAGGHSDKVGYLALRYTGQGTFKAGAITIAQSSGAQAFTGFGGPVGGFLLMQMKQIINQPEFDWRFGVWCGTSTKSGGFAVGGRADSTTVDATNPILQKSVTMVDKFRMLNNDGTENVRATLTSFDADGFTLNFSDPPTYDAPRGVAFASIQWNYITIVNYAASPAVPSRNQAWIIG